MIPHIDVELLKKYDKAGPRYTSYPTAPHFHTNFTLQDLKEAHSLAFSQRRHVPLSLYIHIPYCLAICAYCGCHTTSTNDTERIGTYVQALCSEIDIFARSNPTQRPVQQIHFGGGTPTHIGISGLTMLMEAIHRHYVITRDAEIAIELDPRHTTPEVLQDLHILGFNRLSIGVQGLDIKVQTAIGRVQKPELCAQVVNNAHSIGFESVNIDLIYGLPFQTLESQKNTLEFVLKEMRPNRLAVFNFAYLPELRPNQRRIDATNLPNAETKLQLMKQTIELLTTAGYEYIGLDHFALPNDSLAIAMREGRLHRNFQGYTTLSDIEIIAFGVSSISQLENAYYQNTKDEDSHHTCIRAGTLPLARGIKLTIDDTIRRHVIMSILCQGYVGKHFVENRFEISFDKYFSQENLEQFVEDDLLIVSPNALRVTPKGRLFVRNIAMSFDAHLQKGHQPSTFSRTV